MKFVWDSMPQYINNMWKEQGVMIDSYPKNKEYIKVVPQKHMQSWPVAKMDKMGNPGQWSSGDWLIHWAGRPLDERIGLARLHLASVIK